MDTNLFLTWRDVYSMGIAGQWWLSHITKTDQEYAACLASRTGPKPSSATEV
ncbi:MAG: hypothetical protein NT154_09715 [Verrucomicrobia bacterium]|nr:hypothetical protein [Verrucomicrobiota bacterium]